jgi:hypothetical protein
MSYIVVLLDAKRILKDKNSLLAEPFQKIGVTDASPDPNPIGLITCTFSWGKTVISREKVLFIVRLKQTFSEPINFAELIQEYKYEILEALLGLTGGILVRNPENEKRISDHT